MRNQIKDLVHDMTVGAGFDGEMTPAHVKDVEEYVGQKLEYIHLRWVKQAWDECLQSMAQP